MSNKAMFLNTVIDFENMIQVTDHLINDYLSDPEALQCISRIAAYDEELLKHSTNVAYLTLLMALSRYKSNQTLYEVLLAALLHDYGKIYIQRDILDKPGSLSRLERRVIEQHSVLGYIYLKQYTNLSERILNGVLEHHEKLNGEGYVLSKKGNDINEYSKIIAIADVFDAMVSDRVYHTRFSKDEALEYLSNNKGICFEPDLVNFFMDYMKKNRDDDFLIKEHDFQTKILDLCSCIEL